MNVKHLDCLHQTADSPEEAIIDAAKFFQEKGFPISQVLDLSHISILGSDKLTTLCTLQVGIQFLQVGNDDKATEFLKNLDVGLAEYARVGLVGSFPDRTSHQLRTTGYHGHHQVRWKTSPGRRSNQGIDRRNQSQAGQEGGKVILSLGQSNVGVNHQVHLGLYDMGFIIRHTFHSMFRLIVASRLPIPSLFRVDVIAIALVP